MYWVIYWMLSAPVRSRNMQFFLSIVTQFYWRYWTNPTLQSQWKRTNVVGSRRSTCSRASRPPSPCKVEWRPGQRTSPSSRWTSATGTTTKKSPWVSLVYYYVFSALFYPVRLIKTLVYFAVASYDLTHFSRLCNDTYSITLTQVLQRSTTWTHAYLWRGASAVRCLSTKYSLAHFATSSIGLWPLTPTGSSSDKKKTCLSCL